MTFSVAESSKNWEDAPAQAFEVHWFSMVWKEPLLQSKAQ